MEQTNDSGYSALAMAREWPAVLFMGIITIGLGVVVLVWPSQTLTVLSILLGIQILLAVGLIEDDCRAVHLG